MLRMGREEKSETGECDEERNEIEFNVWNDKKRKIGRRRYEMFKRKNILYAQFTRFINCF